MLNPNEKWKHMNSNDSIFKILVYIFRILTRVIDYNKSCGQKCERQKQTKSSFRICVILVAQSEGNLCNPLKILSRCSVLGRILPCSRKKRLLIRKIHGPSPRTTSELASPPIEIWPRGFIPQDEHITCYPAGSTGSKMDNMCFIQSSGWVMLGHILVQLILFIWRCQFIP